MACPGGWNRMLAGPWAGTDALAQSTAVVAVTVAGIVAGTVVVGIDSSTAAFVAETAVVAVTVVGIVAGTVVAGTAVVETAVVVAVTVADIVAGTVAVEGDIVVVVADNEAGIVVVDTAVAGNAWGAAEQVPIRAAKGPCTWIVPQSLKRVASGNTSRNQSQRRVEQRERREHRYSS